MFTLNDRLAMYGALCFISTSLLLLQWLETSCSPLTLLALVASAVGFGFERGFLSTAD
ncbi:MAG: hypothetical protein ACRDCM_00360 [Plesiomonas shigelloides]|nr:hypothetical protein [Plesiomonas shigelloides]